MNKNVVVVDENDNFIRLEEKLKAHEEAILHRAFSLLVFNSEGEMLIQRRAKSKYHCPGQWANTCCSHPSLETDIENDILTRLDEEMGMTANNLKEIFKFTYKKKFDNGLTEHEIDRVFVGFSDVDPIMNPDEVDDYAWISIEDLYENVKENPEDYTFWFKEILNHEKFIDFIKSRN